MYVVDHLEIGGTQAHLLRVVSRLDRRRFAPMVCALSPRGGLRRAVEAAGVPVFDGGLRGTLRGGSGLRVLWRLVRLFRRERVQVAHAYLFHPNVLAAVAARLAGVPAVVVSKRSLDRYRRAARWACRLGNALADRVAVNAEAVGRFVREEERCPAGKMVLIPNGVGEDVLGSRGDRESARQLIGIPPSDVVVGAVSRLAWKKGIEHLLEAVPQVRDTVAAVHFVIVGEGPLRSRLEARANELGVSGQVRFLGARRDVLDLLPAFDVFVLPSVVEGMSNALLEAMGVGLPVVATDVGGNSEVVVNGESGFLVPPADASALAAAITKLLQAPELAGGMGRAGRQRVAEQYGESAMLRQLEDLYLGLVGWGGG